MFSKYDPSQHLGEQIHCAVLGVHIPESNDETTYLLTQVVKPHPNALAPLGDHEILGQGNAALIVLFKRAAAHSQQVFRPKSDYFSFLFYPLPPGIYPRANQGRRARSRCLFGASSTPKCARAAPAPPPQLHVDRQPCALSPTGWGGVSQDCVIHPAPATPRVLSKGNSVA